MATDLITAIHERFKADPAILAAVPGGWYFSEGPVVAGYPYVVVKQTAGGLSLRTSTSNVDTVRIRMRVFGITHTQSVEAAQALDAWMLAAAPFVWDDGWATVLERIDESDATPLYRAPEQQGVIQRTELMYETQSRRPVHA